MGGGLEGLGDKCIREELEGGVGRVLNWEQKEVTNIFLPNTFIELNR